MPMVAMLEIQRTREDLSVRWCYRKPVCVSELFSINCIRFALLAKFVGKGLSGTEGSAKPSN